MRFTRLWEEGEEADWIILSGRTEREKMRKPGEICVCVCTYKGV